MILIARGKLILFFLAFIEIFTVNFTRLVYTAVQEYTEARLCLTDCNLIAEMKTERSGTILSFVKIVTQRYNEILVRMC